MRKFGLVVGIFLTTVVLAKSSELCILKPARPGQKSEVVPVKWLNTREAKTTADMWIRCYDPTDAQYVLVGLNDVDTFGVFFVPPAKCTLLAVSACAIAYYPTSKDTIWIFAAKTDPTLSVDDWEEYHSGAPVPGPTPIDSFYEQPTGFWVCDTDWTYDTLWLTNPPDVGADPFFAGWVKPAPPDSSPNPAIQAHTSEPWYSLVYRESPANGGDPGWYSSWHQFWIDALIRMYENPPPVIENYDQLAYSYTTESRTVTATITDVGIPLDSSGVKEAGIVYWLNGDSSTMDTVQMTLVEGDSVDGTWSGDIPGQSAVTTVDYYVYAIDYQGKVVESSVWEYVILERTPGYPVLFIIDSDEYYGSPFSPDVMDFVYDSFDVWDAYYYGPTDSSVLFAGYSSIVWVTWGNYDGTVDYNLLAKFLDNGGNLFVSSQDLPATATPSDVYDTIVTTYPGSFTYDYLHVKEYWDDYLTGYGGEVDAGTLFTIYGMADTISKGLDMLYDWGYLFAKGYNMPGAIFDTAGDVHYCFVYPSGVANGLWYDGNYKLVFLYWPYHYLVTASGEWYTDTTTGEWYLYEQEQLLANVLTFFGHKAHVTHPGICELGSREKSLTLYPVTPNPSVNDVVIEYVLPYETNVDVVIYDVGGRTVKTLASGKATPGTYRIRWDGKDSRGLQVGSGIFFLRVSTDRETKSAKIIRLR